VIATLFGTRTPKIWPMMANACFERSGIYEEQDQRENDSPALSENFWDCLTLLIEGHAIV
jgi:hypothetical protein